MKTRPYILTIAGFDPSSGAGLTADLKTMEMLKCYGLAVCTANTIQNDIDFQQCHWVGQEVMRNQIDSLFLRFDIEYVKIGIVENWHVLLNLIEHLLSKNSAIKIILDPVLKSSSGFNFQQFTSEQSGFKEVLDSIYLLTPNYLELKALFDENIHEGIHQITRRTNLLLKGGHRMEAIGTDVLYTKEGDQFTFLPGNDDFHEKHGSGCILSAAITSHLALGSTLREACEKAKRYIERILASNPTLLAYHA